MLPVRTHNRFKTSDTQPGGIGSARTEATMKIAIVGWGSLVWDPRELPRESFWQKPGPALPLEFARVSRDGRLTLVIDPDCGRQCETYYALSPRTDIKDAISDLRLREDTISNRVGFVDVENAQERGQHPAVVATVKEWAETSGFSGVVWTDLAANFPEQTAMSFSVENALAYLTGLPLSARLHAEQYILNAPPEITTPIRDAFNKLRSPIEEPASASE